MITIPRALAKQLRAVLRKAAPNSSARTYKPPLVFQADDNGLRIRAHHEEVAIEYCLHGSLPHDVLVLPTNALDDLEKGKHTDIELNLQKPDLVQARWNDGGMPQTKEYATVNVDKLRPFPDEPKKLCVMETEFLNALDDAAQVAAKDNVRFALMRLQLRGEKGEIVSSDGGQLLIQRGFAFPWKEDFLIPAIGFGGCLELIEEGQVSIGKSDKHVGIRIGAWTFHLTIDRDSRYPRVENVIPSPSSNGTKFHIALDDASFLTNALPKLPGRDDPHELVTVDLNGHIAIRAQDEGQTKATELVLNRSESVGPPVRFASDRRFLARAIKLGFCEFHVSKPDVPIVCRERQRIYLWMPMGKDGIIPPSSDVVRIVSPQGASAQPPSKTERRIKTMPIPQPNSPSPNGSPDPTPPTSERGLGIAELLSEAEDLRSVFQDALTRLHRIINGLKQHRRQSKAMQAAVQSLRQLRLEN